MKDFVAIDFETANNHRTSVCSVGIVVVRGGEIVHRYHSLIRPEPNYYSSFTTEVHGMVYSDTVDERPFPDVWAEVSQLIGNLPLVAHNRPFDESCLRAVFAEYSMPYPNYEFHCTLAASRRKYGAILPNHQLHTVTARCGFDLTRHHHALADAEACAHIALKLL